MNSIRAIQLGIQKIMYLGPRNTPQIRVALLRAVLTEKESTASGEVRRNMFRANPASVEASSTKTDLEIR